MGQQLADLGRPVMDPIDEFDNTGQQTCPGSMPPTPEPVESPKPNWRLPALAAIVSLLIGAATGWAVARQGPSQVPSMTQTEALPAGVAETAELFTSLYLSGDTLELGATALFTGPTPEPSGSWINDAAAVAGLPLGDDLWEVTVAVASFDPVDDVFVPAPLSYFAVTISAANGPPAAIAPPMRVPPPTPVLSLVPQFGTAPGDQANVAAEFIRLFLTADPGAARLLAADSDVTLFDTAPYATATVDALGIDGQGRIAVAVVAETENGVRHELRYYVTLVPIDGVLAVAGIGPSTS